MPKSPSFSSIPPARPRSVPAPALSVESKSSKALLWRLGRFASIVGGLLTLTHVILSRWLERHSGTWQSDILTAIFLSTFIGLLLMSMASLGWASTTFVRLRQPLASKVVAGSVGLVFSFFLLSWAIGESFFLLSGSALTLGSVEFFISGLHHLGSSTLNQYLTQSLSCLVIAGVGFVIAYRVTEKALRETCPCPLASLPRVALSLFGLAALITIFLRPGFAAQTRLNGSPELAFLASVAERRTEAYISQKDEQVSQGAPLNAGVAWLRWARMRAEMQVQGVETVNSLSNLKSRQKLSAAPSVVVIQLESVGINHLGFMGSLRKQGAVTPNLDRIARKSLVFEQARTTATHSNYAQMATLSSLFPRRYSGLDTYGRLDYPRFLLHDALDALGATTGTISSQDETWQGMNLFQTTGTATHFEHSGNTPGKKLDMITEKVIPDSVTAARALTWMNEQAGSFSLYINFQSTHFPYHIPAEAPRPYQPSVPQSAHFNYFGYPRSDLPAALNRYDNALHYVDQQLGLLYDSLAQSGLLESTILVITADHGELFYEHDLVTHGRTLYEEEVRVPLLIHYPQSIRPQRRDEAVSTLDILPTILSLIGAPEHPALQGQSLVKSAGDGLFEVDFDSDRGVFMNIQGMKSQEALVCDQHKLVHDQASGSWRLFDLSTPAGEELDIAAQKPQLARQMQRILRTQIQFQERYYQPNDSAERQSHYAPRLARCPEPEVVTQQGIAQLQE